MPHQCTNCGHVFEDGSKEMLSGCPDCGGNKFQYHPGDVPEDPGDAEPPERDSGGVTDAVGRAANRVRDAVTSGDASPGDDATVADAATRPDDTTTRADDDTPPETEGVGGVDDAASPADAGDAEATQTDAPEAGDSSTDAPGAEGSSTGAREAEDSTSSAAETGGVGSTDAADDRDTEPDSDAEIDAETVADAEAEDSAQASARSDVVDRDSLPDAPSEGRVVQEPDETDEEPDIEALREELNDQFESIRIVAPGQYELNLMELYDRQEYIIALQEDGQYVIEVPDAWDAPDPTDE